MSNQRESEVMKNVPSETYCKYGIQLHERLLVLFEGGQQLGKLWLHQKTLQIMEPILWSDKEFFQMGQY